MIPSEQEEFFFAYVEQRKRDIESGFAEYHGRKKKKVMADFSLLPDVRALAKKLGLKQKDLLYLLKTKE